MGLTRVIRNVKHFKQLNKTSANWLFRARKWITNIDKKACLPFSFHYFMTYYLKMKSTCISCLLTQRLPKESKTEL